MKGKIERAKKFLVKRQKVVNILLPIIITACIFWSGNLERSIAQIHSDYLIYTNTLNNSFITMVFMACTSDKEGFQKIKDETAIYLQQFNNNYDNREKEIREKENIISRLKSATYAMILLMVLFNVTVQNAASLRKNVENEV